MGSMSDLCHDLKSQYPLLSYESVTKKDGSDYILIRSSLPEISRYLPHLNAVVESGVVKLLSYHGKILKEENFAGGIILEQLNEGKLFFCIGVGSLREGLDDSALKDVFSEPSTDGDIVYRSRSCSFFLEDTPGICYNCQMFLESLHKLHEDRGEETNDWVSLNHKEEYDDFEEEDTYDNDDDDWEEAAELSSAGEEECHKQNNSSAIPKLPISCKICSRKFSRKCSYDRHYRQHSSVKYDSVDFEEENESDDKDDDWEEPTGIMAKEGEQCPTCGKVYKESTIDNHIKGCKKVRKFDSEFPFKCEICLLKFKVKGSYTSHFKNHINALNLDESIDCPICNKCLDNRKCLNDHIHESHDSSKGCCVICFEMMPKEDLSKHIPKRHSVSLKKHLCPKCGKKFKFLSELMYHTAMNHDYSGDKFVICEQCGRGFSHKNALARHIRRCHNKSNVFPCDQCKKVFYYKYRLQKHLQIHTGVKPYKCSMCSYLSVRKDNVHIHIRRVHKKESTSGDIITLPSKIQQIKKMGPLK